jgi:hypothetical protein
VLCPLALIDKRPASRSRGAEELGPGVLRQLRGAFTVAVFMAIYVTYGFSTEPSAVGKAIGVIGENRTLGYEKYGMAGMLTLFVRACCATGWSPPAWWAR